MSIADFLEKMKGVQNILLEFLDDELEDEERYKDFINQVKNQNIVEEKHDFKLSLRLINRISNYHRRTPNFISKIERILRYFKADILKYFTNTEIFEIFKENKRVLLFLFEEKIIVIDEHIVSWITSDKYVINKYIEYFTPEIRPFITEEFIQKYGKVNQQLVKENFLQEINKELPEDFFEKRKEGENDGYLCELIRTNQVKEFGIFVNQNNLSLDGYIKISIFETNPLLIQSQLVTLIEYASFFGSLDIIKYIETDKNIELPQNMWYYAIHSGNAELIKYIEDNHVSPPKDDYEIILRESIKYHQNDVARYIIDYLIKDEDLKNHINNNYSNNLYRYAVGSYNFCFFPESMEYKNMFCYLFDFDYYTFVKLFIEDKCIDVNAKSI